MSGVIPKGHQLIFKEEGNESDTEQRSRRSDELTTELLSTSIYNTPRRKV